MLWPAPTPSPDLYQITIRATNDAGYDTAIWSLQVPWADLDADGDLEVVTGGNYVYAWHHDAQEVRDGDNDPLTWGVFNNISFTVTASLALAELNLASPGLEIIAASWSDNRIYAYDVLSGWPVQPANGGSPGYWATPTAVDLDGDGLAEVLAASKDGHLYGFDAAGQPLVGSDGSFGVIGAFT